MTNRVILLVIDGLGVGALPDAAQYGDEDAHTLAHLADAVGGLSLPTLESLGLGHVSAVNGLRTMAQPIACFGRLGFRSKALDSLAGHWELAGCVPDGQDPTLSGGFPPQVGGELRRLFGDTLLGMEVLSDDAALRRFRAEHLATGSPIVWTDGRRTCHVAAHETVLRPDELYRRCREARKGLRPWGVWRLVAHPMQGSGEAVTFGPGRRDLCLETPGPTMLDALSRAGQILIGVGKSGDLFDGRGFTRTVTAGSWTEALDDVIGMLNRVPRGLIYAACDVLAPSPGASAAALQEFDSRLSKLLEQLRSGDLFVLTADHGRDVTRNRTRPTREYVPLLVTGPKLAQGVDLGIRPSAADLGQTIVEALRGEPLPAGESFLDALRTG